MTLPKENFGYLSKTCFWNTKIIILFSYPNNKTLHIFFCLFRASQIKQTKKKTNKQTLTLPPNGLS